MERLKNLFDLRHDHTVALDALQAWIGTAAREQAARTALLPLLLAEYPAVAQVSVAPSQP